MSNDLLEMQKLASTAEFSLHKATRVLAQALGSTLSIIIALRSALSTAESVAQAQHLDLQVALINEREQGAN